MKQEYGEVTIPSHSYKCLVQDSKRLQFLVEERCVVATTKIWEVDHYRLEWPFEGYYQREGEYSTIISPNTKQRYFSA